MSFESACPSWPLLSRRACGRAAPERANVPPLPRRQYQFVRRKPSAQLMARRLHQFASVGRRRAEACGDRLVFFAGASREQRAALHRTKTFEVGQRFGQQLTRCKQRVRGATRIADCLQDVTLVPKETSASAPRPELIASQISDDARYPSNQIVRKQAALAGCPDGPQVGFGQEVLSVRPIPFGPTHTQPIEKRVIAPEQSVQFLRTAELRCVFMRARAAECRRHCKGFHNPPVARGTFQGISGTTPLSFPGSLPQRPAVTDARYVSCVSAPVMSAAFGCVPKVFTSAPKACAIETRILLFVVGV